VRNPGKYFGTIGVLLLNSVSAQTIPLDQAVEFSYLEHPFFSNTQVSQDVTGTVNLVSGALDFRASAPVNRRSSASGTSLYQFDVSINAQLPQGWRSGAPLTNIPINQATLENYFRSASGRNIFTTAYVNSPGPYSVVEEDRSSFGTVVTSQRTFNRFSSVPANPLPSSLDLQLQQNGIFTGTFDFSADSTWIRRHTNATIGPITGDFFNQPNQTVSGSINWLFDPAIRNIKQFSPSIATLEINPEAGTPETISRSGCVISSLSMIYSVYEGRDVRATSILSSIQESGLFINGTNSVNISTIGYKTGSDTIISAEGGGNFSTIVDSLSVSSDPIMLAVPSRSGTRGIDFSNHSGGNVSTHYLVAYGIRADALRSNGEITASDILIADPGYGQSFYGDVPGWSLSIEENGFVSEGQVSLQDYFDAVNRLNNASFDTRSWFDRGEWTVESGGGVLLPRSIGADNRNRLVRTFSEEPVSGNSSPAISVFSPIELVIRSDRDSTVYVTDESLLREGYVLLEKLSADVIAPVEDISEVDNESLAGEDFPAFTVQLPAILEAATLDITAVGFGEGEYAVIYTAGILGTYTADPVLGTTSLGEETRFSFRPRLIPEPSTIFIVCMSGFIFHRHKR